MYTIFLVYLKIFKSNKDQIKCNLLDKFKNSNINNIEDFNNFMDQIDADASGWKVIHRKSRQFKIVE